MDREDEDGPGSPPTDYELARARSQTIRRRSEELRAQARGLRDVARQETARPSGREDLRPG